MFNTAPDPTPLEWMFWWWWHPAIMFFWLWFIAMIPGLFMWLVALLVIKLPMTKKYTEAEWRDRERAVYQPKLPE